MLSLRHTSHLEATRCARTSTASPITLIKSTTARALQESSSSLNSIRYTSQYIKGRPLLASSSSGSSSFLASNSILIPYTSRCIGVVGGLFVCVSYAVRIGTKAIDVVTGTDPSSGLVPPTATKATGARSKWTGGDIRARGKVSDPVRVVQQGSGWVVEKDSPYGSPYNSPYLGASHSILVSPYLPNRPGTPSFGPPPSVTRSSFGPVSPVPPSSGTRSPSVNAPPPYSPQLSHTSPLLSHSTPSNPNDATAGTPLHNHFPPTPGPSDGFGDAKRV